MSDEREVEREVDKLMALLPADQWGVDVGRVTTETVRRILAALVRRGVRADS